MSNEKREKEMMAAADAYVEDCEEIFNIVEAITDFFYDVRGSKDVSLKMLNT